MAHGDMGGSFASGHPTQTKPFLLWLALLALAAGCLRPALTPEPAAHFNGDKAYTWVTQQCDLGYRIPGTEAHRRAGDLIVETLRSLGWTVDVQTFTYRGTPVRNILAWQGNGPAILLGAHYDTRPLADREPTDQPVLGANDGASGVAVLLELARTLDVARTGHTVYLAFFDAEDSGDLNGWPWIVGSTYMADHWGSNGEPTLDAAIIIDMIGDADLNIYLERNSDPLLSAALWDTAAGLGFSEVFITEYRYAILDDHLPFIQRGIPAVDIIDFDYPYWHTTHDTPDKVSPDSLTAVGRTLETWLEGKE